MVSSTPRPHFTPGKDPVPILLEAVWAPGPVWTDGKSRPHRDSTPDRPARSRSLYRLSNPVTRCPIGHRQSKKVTKITPFEPHAQLKISGCTYLYDQQYLLVVNRAGLRGAILARVLKIVCHPCSRPNKFKEYEFEAAPNY